MKKICSIVCLFLAFAASESYAAVQKVPKAVSGEINCRAVHNKSTLGYMTGDTIFHISNWNATQSIQITRLRLYNKAGALLTDTNLTGFPSGFVTTMGPNVISSTNTTDLKGTNAGGASSLKINFSSSDGLQVSVPHASAKLRNWTGTSPNNVTDTEILECSLL